MSAWPFCVLWFALKVAMWALVVTAVVLAIRWLRGHGAQAAAPTPLEILRARYARGEITRQNLESLRRDLDAEMPTRAPHAGFEQRVTESFSRLALMSMIGARLVKVAAGAIDIDMPARADLSPTAPTVSRAARCGRSPRRRRSRPPPRGERHGDGRALPPPSSRRPGSRGRQWPAASDRSSP